MFTINLYCLECFDKIESKRYKIMKPQLSEAISGLNQTKKFQFQL